MSAVPSDPSLASALIPLACGPLDRRFAVGGAGPVSLECFLRQAHTLAEALPAGSHCLNLCEDRYRFILTLTAALLRGQPTLLPPSRAPSVILEMLDRYPEAHCVGDDGLNGCPLERLPPRYTAMPAVLAEWQGPIELPQLPAESLAVIGFTSGSSGPPKAQPKRWGSFSRSTALNAALLREFAGAGAQILATVPAQHMYGMETSVLLPLLGGFPIHPARPFFPADIVRALNELAAPRVLVTTPVHLRALVESGLSLPPIAAIVSATAPLPVELARAAEAASGGRVLEFYGSTETCVIAHRQSARDEAWTAYEGVEIQPRPDGAQIDAAWLAAPVLLQDLIELLPQGRFRLAGRAADLLEIAGKRASLGELTRRLLAIPGVQDGVVFLPDSMGPVQRVAALVVAPELDEAAVLAALREVVDPVYLPRPLKRVAALPRNATGKLPRAALLASLRGG
ncbi:MAG: AMP-ligase [Lysobacteraceae bacterium SCN 69-123]|nr:MAG: AMP-ligase [Xanthomonadaceae bacterium SCN 69-123]